MDGLRNAVISGQIQTGNIKYVKAAFVLSFSFVRVTPC